MANADVRTTSAADNPLCARLQTKFISRGIAANDLTRTASIDRSRFNSKGAEKIRKAADPFEDTARFTPAAASMKAETARFNAVKTDHAFTASSASAQENARRRTAAGEVTTPFASGAYAAAYARAADIRRMAYDGSMAKAAQARESQRRNVEKAPFPLTPAWFKHLSNNVKNDARGEVKVDNPPVSKGIIIAVILFAVVVMMIIFSFSQISEFKREISDLEAQRSALCEEIDKLSLDVDFKNNVRDIERAATEDIGMVKSNQVQSKYVSLSNGERIEVISHTSDEAGGEYGVLSTVMSVFDRNWDNLMDYIG